MAGTFEQNSWELKTEVAPSAYTEKVEDVRDV